MLNKGGFGGFSTKEASCSVHENFYCSYCQAQFSCGFGCFVNKPDSRTGGWGREEGRDDFPASRSEAEGWMC